MKFSFGLITTLVSIALCGVVHAAPAPLCDRTSGLCARDVADSMMGEDLVARDPTSKNVVAAQKAQGQRAKATTDKKTANAKTLQKAANSVKTKVNAFRHQAKKGVATPGQVNAQSDKIRAAEKSRVAAQARMDKKTAKTQHWAAQKKTTEQKKATKAAAANRRQERKKTGAPRPANQAKLAKNVKPTKEQKADVKNRFKDARQKFKETEGMPTRGQTLTVGAHSTKGRAVRQAVFNSYLHGPSPIGRNPDNRQPKDFENRPYSATHGDASLRGKRPLPEDGKNFKEYPVINKSPNGWTGSGDVGALRAVTYEQGGKRRAAVIGHDPSRGGDHSDHYVATREVEGFDMEDLE